MEREVKIRGLLIDPTTSTPVVLLKSVKGDSVLPIWVGPFEANAIASEIEKRVSHRPMPHDLIKNLLVQIKAALERVTITELRDSTFYALIQLKTEYNQALIIDARPSDAIALALRCDCPMFIKDQVFELSSTDSLDVSRVDIAAEAEEEVEWPNELQ